MNRTNYFEEERADFVGFNRVRFSYPTKDLSDREVKPPRYVKVAGHILHFHERLTLSYEPMKSWAWYGAYAGS